MFILFKSILLFALHNVKDLFIHPKILSLSKESHKNIIIIYIMFNTFNNLSRKSDRYGDVHFISFLGATLSRLAYLNDNTFLTNYSQIMGPVIQPKILTGINSVDTNNLTALLDDQTIFGLNKGSEDIFANYETRYNGKNFIDFIGLNMPQNINIINRELKGENKTPVPGAPTPPNTVKYISIGWSNYGEIYVVADKRTPNTIFLIFRGTYSAKTAGLYSKPTSAVTLEVCKDSNGVAENFLYGIFKPSSEMIHTIIETLRYLATDFLGATQPNSVKIFTTGHSLGGAMCTNFAYLWMGVKKTPPYNSAPYNVLADNIICVSLGAPRSMGSSVAKKFCNFVKQKKILFLRITTRGDPVPGLPPKKLVYGTEAFQHPCSDDKDMRKETSEDCNSTLTMRPIPNVNYSADLDCQNYKTRAYAPNALSHTIYLDILYLSAVDIDKFFKGIGIAQEVFRNQDKTTNCRLIMGDSSGYKAVFFSVDEARLIPKKEKERKKIMPKFGGQIDEDVRVTKEAYDNLILGMVPLKENLCPQVGQIIHPFIVWPSMENLMPDLSCPGTKFGGRRTRKMKSKKSKKSKKRHTRRH